MGSMSTSTDPENFCNGDDNLLVKSVLCCEENCYKQILVVEIERGPFLSSKLVYCCLHLNHNAIIRWAEWGMGFLSWQKFYARVIAPSVQLFQLNISLASVTLHQSTDHSYTIEPELSKILYSNSSKEPNNINIWRTPCKPDSWRV